MPFFPELPKFNQLCVDVIYKEYREVSACDWYQLGLDSCHER